MSNTLSISLGEALTIAHVQDAHSRLGALLDSAAGKTIEIDASELAKIDAAGVQLITAFLRAASNGQKKVAINQPSQVFTEGFELLGLESEIQMFLDL